MDDVDGGWPLTAFALPAARPPIPVLADCALSLLPPADDDGNAELDALDADDEPGCDRGPPKTKSQRGKGDDDDPSLCDDPFPYRTGRETDDLLWLAVDLLWLAKGL